MLKMQQNNKKLIRIKVRFASKSEKNKSKEYIDFLLRNPHSTLLRVYGGMLMPNEELLYEATKNKIYKSVVE